MTTREFIIWAEGYYGEYQVGQIKDVTEYLETWDVKYLDALKTVLAHNYTSQFKTPPDIAAMNKVYPLVVAERDRAAGYEPRELPSMTTEEKDRHKAARLHADMKAVGVTMNDKGWMQKVIDYRTKRGDYGEHLRIGPRPRWGL